MELLWILLQVAGSRGNQWNGILMVGIVVLIIYIFIRKVSPEYRVPKYSNNQIKETIIVNQKII